MPDGIERKDETNDKDGGPRHSFCHGARLYEIRVRGHLSSHWSDWFEGMELRWTDRGETILSGPVVDQAALMGILNKLHRLNLTLLSIEQQEERARE